MTRRAGRLRAHNYDAVAGLVARRVEETRGRISAKRLLAAARAEGYQGSDRNFRRVVARARVEWRRQGRLFRPWRPGPGDFLMIDYGAWAGWQVFCAVLVWSRMRFVRLSHDQRQATTLALLAECFEAIGGVPAVLLADRIACLRGPIVADRVVAHPNYVRFAAHRGFRPDWCESHDPESKGVVENLVGYAKSDLVMPACDDWGSLGEANTAAGAWCAEVNARVHSEIAAVPAERLAQRPSTTSAGSNGARAGEPLPRRPRRHRQKSHLLIAAGHAAVEAGHRVRYLTAAELIKILYRGLATTASAASSTRCCATTSSW